MSRWSIQRVMIVVVGGVIALIVILFLIAVVMAVTDVDRWAPVMTMFRDLTLLIFLIVGILIVTSLAVLILQGARLLQVLREEIRAVLTTTRETFGEARGTVEFIGENVAEPLIHTRAFMSGLLAFIRELVALWKVVQSTDSPSKEGDELKTEPEQSTTDMPAAGD